MLGYANTTPGYYGAAVNSAAPVMPQQTNYYNPYCAETNIPAGSTAYINPMNVGNTQNMFVNQMQSYARQQFNQPYPYQNTGVMDYYTWKLQTGSRPRNAQEEEQLQHYFYQTVKPAMEQQAIIQRQQMMQQRYQGGQYNQPVYQQNLYQGGYYQPNYQQPLYQGGYYNQGYYQSYSQFYARQVEEAKKQLANHNHYMHLMQVNALCIQYGYTKEEAEKILADVAKKQQEMIRERQVATTNINVKIYRGDELVREIKQTVPKPFNDTYDDEYYRCGKLANQKPVEYIVYSPMYEYLRRTAEKYNHLSAAEFFEVGGELVAEVRENKRREQEKYRMATCYNHSAYTNLIKQYEDKDGKYNDGIYQDLVSYRLELERNAPEGFHYDKETGKITITAPDDFDKFTKGDLQKSANRRMAFYKHIMNKHPDIAHVLNGLDGVTSG